MVLTLDQYESLLDLAAERAIAAVGYDSPLFVNQALAERDQLIAERNITGVLNEAHHHQEV